MKDSGVVISTHLDLAHVRVQCLVDACSHCSAKVFCTGRTPISGLLTVKNPLQASVGDEVEISIPEERYSRTLILIFSSLLLASLLGAGMGALLSSLLSLPSSLASILGLFLALLFSSFFLLRHFRRKKRESLYPIITHIIHKGGGYA